MAAKSEKEQLEAQLKADYKFVKEGIAYHSPQDLQFAKDRIAAASKRLHQIDYETRKPFIKIATVEEPVGNSSVNARRGKRFTVAGEIAARNKTTIDL